MRIALMTLGTRGDIHPIVALGAQLRRRGYEVVLGLSVNLVEIAHRLGLDAVPLGWDSEQLIESAAGRAWVAAGDAEAFSRQLYQLTQVYEERLDDEVIALCEGADAIVTGVLLESRALALSQATGVPVVVQDCFPRRINGVVPHPLVTVHPLATEAANRATYLQFVRLNREHTRESTQRFRDRLGLPARAEKPARRPLELQSYSAVLTPGLTWDSHRPYVGDMRLDRADLALLGSTALDPELDAWLDAGDPPAFLTFGSTFTEEPAAMLDTVARVCREAGLRALVATGWGLAGLAARSDEQLRVLPYVDYDLVLPRCALVVHHGSASITASGVRAGLPTMVCSSFFDQPFWGEQLARLGIGVHVRFHELTGEVLRDGLQRLREPAIRDRAAEYGRRLRAEPEATSLAAKHIEAYLGSWAAPLPG